MFEMAAPIQSPAKCEVCSIIPLLNAKGESPAEIHKQIVAVYGNVMISTCFFFVFLMCIFVNCICLVCIVVTLCVIVVSYVYLLYYVCNGVLISDVGLLARSQYPEGPATNHLDTGFSWFPCVYKRMLRWFPSFQVATTCLSCSPPDLNFLVTFFIFVYM